jgi:hypothetical protein
MELRPTSKVLVLQGFFHGCIIPLYWNRKPHHLEAHMAQIFIGYSRKDRDFVQKLHQSLTRERHNVWVDWEDIPPTAKWLNEIYKGVESADAYVFVVSPDSVTSEVCGMEIEHGEKFNKRFIPILYRDLSNEKPRDSIASCNWILFNEEEKHEGSLRQLLSAVEMDLEYVEMHTELLLKAKEWLLEQRNVSYLLQGDQLRKAETWLAESKGKKPEALKLHETFIAESLNNEKENEDQKNKRKIYMALRDETLRVYIRPFLIDRRKELEKHREKLRRETSTALSVEIVELEEELNGIMNFLSAGGKWHLNEPIVIKKLGPQDDYLNIFEFPCCGTQVPADKAPSRFRSDGCLNSPLAEDVDDEPAPSRTLLHFHAREILKQAREKMKSENVNKAG